MTPAIDVQYACTLEDLPSPRELERWVASAVGKRRASASVSLRIVNEAEAKALNERWLGKDYATNVLAFPCEGIQQMPELLGDIVICAPLVVREAETQAKPVTAHWAHLVIHGTLHLLGFDHESSEDAEEMESIEVAALQSIGFADPYEAVT